MLRTIKYDVKYLYDWDSFVDCSWNGTIFHTRRFLSYHEDRFEDKSLIFAKDNDLVGVFPAARKGDALWSHPGASFGGIVLRDSGIEDMLSIVDSITSYARDEKFKSISMVLTPNIFHLCPVEGIEFALWYKGYRASAIELSICLPIGDSQFSDRRRRGVRKAEKEEGLHLTESQDLKAFWKILSENLRIRHSVTPTHTLEEIERLKYLFPDDIKLFSAFLDGRMIAGILVFINNLTSFETFYIAQNYEFQKVRAMDALVQHVHDWGLHNLYKYLNFGITSEDRGKKINYGLAKFKEEFGGCDIVRRIYSRAL